MSAALGWGALAASSLVIGALLGLAAPVAGPPGRARAGVRRRRADQRGQLRPRAGRREDRRLALAVAIGLAAGALTYCVANLFLERKLGDGDAGPALALGAFLDGIPEQAVLGIGLASGEGVGVGLLAAIFVSNLPEAIGSASDMRESGRRADRRPLDRGRDRLHARDRRGYVIADNVGGDFQGGVNGFAAGALLVMLTDSMIPEARKKGGNAAGLVTVLGFAVAAALSELA